MQCSMSEVVKGFMEDYDGEMVLGDIRNFKDELDFMKQTAKYVEETRGYMVPVLPPTKMEIMYSDLIGEWWTEDRVGFVGRKITVFKSELEWEDVDI